MKILILEDNPSKYDNTVKYVRKLFPEAEVVWVEHAITGVQTMRDIDIDYVIIDMQMPLRDDERIDREAGILVLNYLEEDISKNKDIKFCINSSSESTKTIMENKGFKDVHFIHNSSMYDLTNDFKEFFK